MPTGLQMPAGEPPVSRKKAVPPRPDESRTWNFLSGDGPSAPPPAGSGPTYYQQPKPFKPGWKERRKEECINQSAERKESEARQAARKETHGKLRFAVIADKRDYTGVDPIKGTVRDEVKAVPPAYGRRGMPERSAEVRARVPAVASRREPKSSPRGFSRARMHTRRDQQPLENHPRVPKTNPLRLCSRVATNRSRSRPRVGVVTGVGSRGAKGGVGGGALDAAAGSPRQRRPGGSRGERREGEGQL